MTTQLLDGTVADRRRSQPVRKSLSVWPSNPAATLWRTMVGKKVVMAVTGMLPALPQLRDVAVRIATAVGRQAQRDGVAPQTSDAELRARIAATQWTPAYPSFAPSKQ